MEMMLLLPVGAVAAHCAYGQQKSGLSSCAGKISMSHWLVLIMWLRAYVQSAPKNNCVLISASSCLAAGAYHACDRKASKRQGVCGEMCCKCAIYWYAATKSTCHTIASQLTICLSDCLPIYLVVDSERDAATVYAAPQTDFWLVCGGQRYFYCSCCICWFYLFTVCLSISFAKTILIAWQRN